MTGSLGKLVSPLRPAKKSRHTVVTNRWDERVWTGVRSVDLVSNLIYDLTIGDEHHGGTRKGFEPAPELIHDLFMSFYKATPDLVPKRDLDRDVYVVHKMVKELLDNPNITDFQEMTAGNEMETLMALGALGDTVREILNRVPPPPPPPQPKSAGGGEKSAESGDSGQPSESGEPGESDDPTKGDQGEGQGENQGGDPDGDDQNEPGDEDGEVETPDFDPHAEADAEEADWQAAYDKLLDDEGLDLERAMHKGLDAANAEVEELDRLRKGIGLEDGEWKQMSPAQRLAMAERLRTPEMKALSSVIGRMKRFALGVKATRISDVPHEAYDVEMGNDVRRLLRSEFALLATPQTTYEFYRRFVDAELLQYKMRGTEDVGKGPIVIAIDKSGSMSGGPFHWAMAVAEALRRFAAEEDRDYFAYFFGNNKDRNRFEFAKGTGPFEKVMAFLSVAADGGTQFDGVLTEALQKASTAFDGEARGKADIVFVTDGFATLTDEWITNFNAERARVGVRVYSVFIGGAYDIGGKSPVNILDRISDAVIPVRDLEPEAARRIFAKV